MDLNDRPYVRHDLKKAKECNMNQQEVMEGGGSSHVMEGEHVMPADPMILQDTPLTTIISSTPNSVGRSIPGNAICLKQEELNKIAKHLLNTHHKISANTTAVSEATTSLTRSKNLHVEQEDPPNIVHLLNARQLGISPNRRPLRRQVEQFGELKASVSKMEETLCELPPSARSTFVMSFSHDCSRVASTHGDHHIYVSDVKTGKHVKKLEGHRRTPWCIAFHPTSNDILASGCLSGEVRVWDLEGGSEKWRTDHDEAIASLAFHPIQQLLVIATSTFLYFWDWSQPKPEAWCSTNSRVRTVRYVKFDRYGNNLITGISNISTQAFYPIETPIEDVVRRARTSFFNRMTSDLTDHLVGATPRPAQNPFPSDALNWVENQAALSQALSEASDRGALSEASDDEEQMSRAESVENLNTDDEAQARVINEHSYNLEPPEVVHHMSDEFWTTCARLRTTCRELEMRLLREIIVLPSDEMESRPGPSHSDDSDHDFLSPLAHAYADPYSSIIAMLIRIRRALHFSSPSLNAIRERVEQVRRRTREIISRLRYWNVRRYWSNTTQINPEIFNGLEEIAGQLDEQMERLLRIETRYENVMSTSDQNAIQLMEMASHSPENPEVAELRPQQQRQSAVPNAIRTMIRDSFRETLLQVQQQIQLPLPSPSISRADELFPPNRRAGSSNLSQEFRLLNSTWDFIEDPPSPESDDDSDDSDRPATPPLLMPSPASAMFFDGTSRLGLCQDFSTNHRIQCWDFTRCAIPPIYNEHTNIVVERCMLHNDSSIDISQDGEKLVALIPRFDHFVCFGVFSLKSKSLGKRLCQWGCVTNVISVSLSPLANFALIGYAYSSLSYSDPEKKVVAQIVKINEGSSWKKINVGNASNPQMELVECFEALNIRSFTRMVANDNRFESVGLNSLQWIPQSGMGFAYATNRGGLCIVKPKNGNIHRDKED